MNAKRPDIFGYQEYQAFLRDWFAFKKANQSKFSLRWLAKEAGLASGYLPMILSKKRVLSMTALTKMLPFLGLTPNEQSFLENLIKFQSSDSNEGNMQALERMKRFQKFQLLNPRETEVSDYLTHWSYVAIRELATIPGFRDDAEWVQEQLRFSVPLSEVKEALEFLFENGYLTKKADGTVRPPEKALDCSAEVFRVALAKFHREIFYLASQSIEKTPREERNIQGHTCALNAKNFNKARKIMDEALEKIRELGENEKQGESVYHMEVALFPLTKAKGSKT